MLNPPVFLLTIPSASFVDPYCYLCFVFVCNTVLSVPCSLVVTFQEKAELLSHLYAMSGVVFDCIKV